MQVILIKNFPPPVMSQTVVAIGHSLNYLKVSQYSQIASTSIVIYEHLITLDDEISLIWPSTWTPVKVLFLLNRYHGLIVVSINTYVLLGPPKLTDNVRTRFFKWQGWTALISCIFAYGILQMRLYALYSLDKRMLAVVVASFVATLMVSGYILSSILTKVMASAEISPFGGMLCFAHSVLPTFYLFWVPLMVFECLLLGLAICRGLQTLRHSGSLGRKVVTILLRDSVVYFLGICITYGVCLVFGIFAPVSLIDVPIVFTIAMPCVLSNRMVLNIREARRGFTARVRHPLSPIVFR